MDGRMARVCTSASVNVHVGSTTKIEQDVPAGQDYAVLALDSADGRITVDVFIGAADLARLRDVATTALAVLDADHDHQNDPNDLAGTDPAA